MLSFKELKKILKDDVSDFPTIKVALVGDTSTQFLATAIKGVGRIDGYKIDLFEADYNQVEYQLMNSNSEVYKFDPEFIIVFQSTHKLNIQYSKMLPDEQRNLADIRLNFITNICNITSAKVIYFNYPEIDDSIFGSFANKIQESFIYQVRKLNYGLMNCSQQIQNLYICDVSSLQNKFGRNYTFDPAIYVSTDMVFSLDIIPYVASRVLDIMVSIKGKTKKCIILDLDNTIWGGIIGDDGLEGIQLGHGLGIGKAFSEFQLWIKKLQRRGIIICICSKNEEAIAKEPFEKHPDMFLHLDDIAIFKANWNSKVDNIKEIQKNLNIGFDSMVFLDDNPYERNLVRESIKDISVPELPEDPANYLEFLYSINIFETSSYSSEDKERTKQYQNQYKRDEFSKTFTNEQDFLKSLNMISKIDYFNDFNIPRIAQLSQRSNQFNLRTIRYTENDIHKIIKSKEILGLSFTLEDKFGDNGLVSVVILNQINSDTFFIDTWLMSCRVLKRGLEDFVLNRIVSEAKKRKIKNIIGEYLPTQKNGIVKDFYVNLGFTRLENKDTDQFILQTANFKNRNSFIAEKYGE